MVIRLVRHVVFFAFIIPCRYYYTFIICISHYKRNMVNYNHQKEVGPDPLSVTTQLVLERLRVNIMKKIMEKVNEFFDEYYKSFAEKF